MDSNTKHLAKERVETLFKLAKKVYDENPVLAQFYVTTARKVAMAAKIRLRNEHRRQVCRHCKTFVLPGVNCRVRVKQRREPHVVITCLNCGKQTRIPLAKKESELRK
jgi:ribonuclease P protein subunit RPR2